MAEREKADVVFLNLLDEKQHFSDTSQQESKKMRKLENIFQDTEKTRKINVKQVQQIKETDKIVFFWW